MKLYDVVRAITVSQDVPQKDIERTILLLVGEDILQDPRAFRRIMKRLNNILKYDEEEGGSDAS